MRGRTDVLIAGAGPAGSALAIRLARAGIGVTLVERATFPRPKPCADYLGPESLRLLDQLGVLAAAEQIGRPVIGTTVYGPKGAQFSGRLADASTDHPPFRPTGLAVSRTALDALLAEAAVRAGATLLERATVSDLIQAGNTVTGLTVQDSHGRRHTLGADLTVGADGLRSVVARRAGWFRTFRPKRMAFVAYLNGIDNLTDQVELHVGTEGYVGVNRLGGERANVALVVPCRQLKDLQGHSWPFFVEALSRFPGLTGRLPTLTAPGPLTVTGPFAVRSKQIVGNGLALVGDAAEFFDPFTGEGVFAALAGAALLATTVQAALPTAEGPISSRALAPYARNHRQLFRGKHLVERMIGYGMMAPSLFDRAVDRLGRRGLAPTLLGVTGDFVPARAVLNPLFLAGMVL